MTRLESALARLGAFSPLVTLRTFTPGARTLLRDAERSADLALHAVRAVIWLLLIPIGFVAWSFPPAIVVMGIVGFAALWSTALAQLRRSRPPTWLPYLLTTLDVYLLTEGAFALHSPLAGLYATASLAFAVALRPDQLAPVIPPLYVFVALSGALRVDPRKAMYASALSLVGYSFFALAFAVPAWQALVTGVTIAIAGVVGTNGARVLRYHVLKAREEAILEGYVPAALKAAIERTGAVERAAHEERITLFLSDIRGFTGFSEAHTPEEAVAFLDEYLGIVTVSLVAQRGVVDKYIGDGVLALFEGEGHERRAYAAAREILERVGARNAAAREPLRVGIALHTGMAVLGTVGVAARRDYTVIGDAANVVARLEELNKRFESELVVSGTTAAALTPEQLDGLDGPREVEVRGREAVARVYLRPVAVSLREPLP